MSFSIRHFLGLLLALTLTGCTHTPRVVEASTALVTEQVPLTGTPIPEKYWANLESIQTTYLHHESLSIEVGPNYTSSLGYVCREIHLSDTQNLDSRKRIACQQKASQGSTPGWLLIRDIVLQDTYVSW